MQYEILPSVKCRTGKHYNWANNFSIGFIFECTPFCYYREHTEYNIGSGGWECISTSRNGEVEICTRDIPCAMTINNVIDCVI